MSILISSQNDKEHRLKNHLKTMLPAEEIHSWPDCGDKAAVEIAVLWGSPDDFFTGLTNLKVIFSLAAGVEHVLNHPGAPEGVPIVRLEDAGMGEKMAEYVLYGVLHAQRKFAFYAAAQKKQTWANDAGTTHARDFRIGILGLGVLGSCVAQRLLVNGYAVAGWSRNPKTLSGIETHHGSEGLKTMLPTVDVLVCLLPLTSATQHILDASLFAQARPGLFLVNLARGGHLKDADLLDALDSGQLSGALLDVTEPEPLPAKHAFWAHPDIILTPHIAGPTQEEQALQQIVRNIGLFRNGEKMSGLVDPGAGY